MARSVAVSLSTGLLLSPSRSSAEVQDPVPPPAQKYRFPTPAAVGDTRTVDDVLEMQFEVVVTIDGQETISRFSKRSREAYTEEILGAVRGKRTVVRRKYTAHREAETGPNGESKIKVSSLQGKTVTIRINGRKVVVTADKGKLASADVKKLQVRFGSGDSASEFLPDRELAPGEEWILAPEVVAKTFAGMGKGDVKGRFERIFDESGRSLAEFGLVLELEGSGGGSPVPISMKGNGQAFYDLTHKRELGARFSGPIVMDGEVEQDGKKVRITGSGTVDGRQTVRWLKVAGKAVKGPAYPPATPPAP